MIDPAQDNSLENPPTANKPAFSKGFFGLLALIMTAPAAVPILVVVQPNLVPFYEPVDAGTGDMMPFMIGISVLLLVGNWTILYIMYRWLNNQAAARD